MASINLADAQRVIEAAAAKAAAIGIKVSIAVVDDGAHIVALHRMDGAAPLTPPVAEGKAMAAALLRRDGAALLTLATDRPAFWSAVKDMTRGTMVPGLGSTVLHKKGEAVGAVGVSGGRPEQDAECAEAGASSIG